MKTNTNRSIQLNNGSHIPTLGFGTYELKESDMDQAVESCIRNGIRHIDCAEQYANQQLVGKALDRCINELKIVKREDLFVTSKLWSTHHGKYVREACLRILKDLRVEYLDLLLIHYPIALEFNGWDLSEESHWRPLAGNNRESGEIPVRLSHVSLCETWREMEKLVEEGLVKNIGVSNYTIALLCDLMSYARIKPVVHQIEVHPYFNNKTLIQQAKLIGDIQTIAYSPFGKGAKSGVLDDPVINQIAKQHNRTSAQIILRWAIQNGLAVIPKSRSPERILQNTQIFDFELTSAEMNRVNNLNKNQRVVDPIEWLGIDLFH